MSTLKGTLENLASQFASSILNALRSASIEEVMSVTGARVSAAAASAGASAAAPAKRGPGRPKKVAAAAPAPAAAAPAAPKKRGRPAGSGKKAAPAAAPKAAAPKAAAPKAAAPKAAAPKAKKTATGRLARRSVEDIGGVVTSIVSLLEQHSDGLRAEQIRGALGLDAKELPRPLADGLAAGTITKTGQKRATTYFAGGKGKKRR